MLEKVTMINNIKTKENASIVKTIKLFSITASIFSLLSGISYFALGLYLPATIVIFVGILFFVIYFLNKKEKHILARVLAIVTTNLGVLFFSPYIGFEGGIYLYLFTAPQLIFLLFTTKQKRLIYFCMSLNLITSISVYLIEKYNLIENIGIHPNEIQLIFNANFVFSFIFSFILVSIFAKNNEIYIDMLVDVNMELINQQEILKLELIEKNKMNIALEKSIKEKETLLSEVHHRVKNNLAVVSGLLELENIFVKEKSVSDILKDSKNRIKSIALLHEKLYQHKNFDTINMKDYITGLIDFIQLSYSKTVENVEIHTNLSSVLLTMEIAQPFSLLINELITNSYKHAFKGKDSGIISIHLFQFEETIKFEYKDNGIGFNMNEAIKKDSTGINLINAFVEQLDGELTDQSKSGEGCHLFLTF